jgi:ferredoxin
MGMQTVSHQIRMMGVQHRADLVPLTENEVRFEIDMCIGCDRCMRACPVPLSAIVNIADLNLATVSDEIAPHVTGRLLDIWQARVIARDASANGVGIAKAIPGRLLELEYFIERLNAGKSEPFKHYCIQAMSSVGKLPMPIPTIEPREQTDFEQAYAALEDHARLAASFKKQNRARSIFRVWRRVHLALVPLMLLIVTYHAVLELIVNVLHLAKP